MRSGAPRTQPDARTAAFPAAGHGRNPGSTSYIENPQNKRPCCWESRYGSSIKGDERKERCTLEHPPETGRPRLGLSTCEAARARERIHGGWPKSMCKAARAQAPRPGGRSAAQQATPRTPRCCGLQVVRSPQGALWSRRLTAAVSRGLLHVGLQFKADAEGRKWFLEIDGGRGCLQWGGGLGERQGQKPTIPESRSMVQTHGALLGPSVMSNTAEFATSPST